MSDPSRIVDKSSLHRYRTELPNLVVDSDLSVYAFRLYVHLKRRAGDDGSCWEGTRALADTCRMSMGQVSKAKQELLDKGLIRKSTRATRGGKADDITIVDVWPENFRKYSKDESVHTVNTSEEPFTTRTPKPESVHHTNALDESVHTVNVKRSYSEQEEEPRKKNKRERESPARPAVEIYTRLTDRQPNKFDLEFINQVVDLAKWEREIKNWLASGHRPANVKGMFDWYQGKGRHQQNGQHPADNRPPLQVKPFTPAADALTPDQVKQRLREIQR